MLVLSALAALTLAHLLPGLLLVKASDVGRDLEERLLLAAVLGGPLAAFFYLATLLAGWAPLHWILLGMAGAAAVVLPWRTRKAFAWTRKTRLVLGLMVAGVAIAYLSTTGSSYRLDAEGNLLLDRALQRDALFHLGVIRSLEHAYPPELLSVSGLPIGYHVGYHLQLAAWSRFFGIAPMDGLIRIGALLSMTLLVGSAFVLARRFTESERARLWTPLLIFGSGLGFLFFFRPSVDWWSLVFMDVTLVSVLLSNPLLPALPLLFAGLALLQDHVASGARGSLLASAYALAALLMLKMFLGAQVLGALAVAALVGRDRRLRNAFVIIALASLPFLAHTFLAAESSNTHVGLRPLEIVRYSMEKLDWSRAVSSLANVGSFDAPRSGWALPLASVALWCLGFLGLRIVALPGLLRDLTRGAPLRSTMAWFAIMGFPIALVFRIAPAESQGLSRLEAQNDVVWFAAQSGIFLWFWTAAVLDRFRPLVSGLAVALFALPATVQHFAYAAALAPDRISASRVEAARAVERISPPEGIWLESPDRVRPSLVAYLAGRPVVYDPYVGYDYMFLGGDVVDSRYHAVAQFWSSTDPGYLAWFLDHLEVDFVWREGRPLAAEASPWLEPEYANDQVELLRVRQERIDRALALPLKTPGRIPLGGRGFPFLDDGWRRPPGAPRHRELLPGGAKLYLPRERGRAHALTLRFSTPHAPGELVIEDVRVSVGSGDERAGARLPPPAVRGLDAVEVTWLGPAPLTVTAIELEAVEGDP